MDTLHIANPNILYRLSVILSPFFPDLCVGYQTLLKQKLKNIQGERTRIRKMFSLIIHGVERLAEQVIFL